MSKFKQQTKHGQNQCMIHCYSLVYATTNNKPNMHNAYQQCQFHQLILFVVLCVRCLSVNISSEIQGLWSIFFYLYLSFCVIFSFIDVCAQLSGGERKQLFTHLWCNNTFFTYLANRIKNEDKKQLANNDLKKNGYRKPHLLGLICVVIIFSDVIWSIFARRKSNQKLLSLKNFKAIIITNYFLCFSYHSLNLMFTFVTFIN